MFMKKWWIVIAFLLAVFWLIWQLSPLFITREINPEYLIATSGDIQPDGISLKLSSSPDHSYQSYDYQISDNSLYIIVYGRLALPSKGWNTLDVTIDDDCSNVQKIYFKGDGKSVLFWDKSNGEYGAFGPPKITSPEMEKLAEFHEKLPS